MDASDLNELSLHFQLIAPDGPLETDWQRIVNIAADFQLVVGNRVLVSEAHFPIVELALQLERWLECLADAPHEFVYPSLESQIPSLIRISPGVEGWHVSTALADFADGTALTLDDIVAAAQNYLAAVDEAVHSEYGFRLAEVVLPA